MDELTPIFIRFRGVPAGDCPGYLVTAEVRAQISDDWKQFEPSQGRSGPRVYHVIDRSSAREPISLMLRLEDVLSIG